MKKSHESDFIQAWKTGLTLRFSNILNKKNLVVTLLSTSVLLGCQKETLVDPQSERVEDIELRGESGTPGTPYTITNAGEIAEPGTTDQWYFMQFDLFNSNQSSPIYYWNEAELAVIFEEAGMTSGQIQSTLNSLFHSTVRTAVYVHAIGEIIAAVEDFPADHNTDSFRAWNNCIEDFDVTGLPGTQYGCPYGEITYSNTGGSFLGEGNVILLTGAVNQVRIQNQCTNQVLNISINETSIQNALISSGYSASQAAIVHNSLREGEFSVEAYWKLFQGRIVPYLPQVQALVAQSLMDCWRFVRVILAHGLDLDPPGQCFYRVDGFGQIYCGGGF